MHSQHTFNANFTKALQSRIGRVDMFNETEVCHVVSYDHATATEVAIKACFNREGDFQFTIMTDSGKRGHLVVTPSTDVKDLLPFINNHIAEWGMKPQSLPHHFSQAVLAAYREAYCA